MAKFNSIAALVAGAAVALPAAYASGRVAIATDRIASAISAAGLPISPQQVTLLSEVQATTNLPALKVESMERLGDRRTMVRLSCATTEQCLPFFVAVRGNNRSEQLPGTTAPTQRAKHSSEAVVMHSGSTATLLLDGDRIHIQLAVVCLENGAVGQTIRVASKDRKMTYQAEVVDGTILRGRL
jgi:hypothetical protein